MTSCENTRIAECGCLICDTHGEIMRECNLVPWHKDLVTPAMHKKKIEVSNNE